MIDKGSGDGCLRRNDGSGCEGDAQRLGPVSEGLRGLFRFLTWHKTLMGFKVFFRFSLRRPYYSVIDGGIARQFLFISFEVQFLFLLFSFRPFRNDTYFHFCLSNHLFVPFYFPDASPLTRFQCPFLPSIHPLTVISAGLACQSSPSTQRAARFGTVALGWVGMQIWVGMRKPVELPT